MTEAAKIPKRGSDGSQHTSRDIPAAFVEVAQLVPYARNARTHSDAQVAQLAASIVEWGWTNPILADAKGIVAGHGRLAAARLLYGQGRVLNLPNGEDIPAGCVPVIDVTGWTETKRRAYVLADNQLAMNAGWDDAMLTEELRAIRDDGFDLALVGFDELPDLDDPEPTGDPEQVPDAPATPRSRQGDLWLMGKHRLLCGDSAKGDDVARLMGDEKADLVLTDPPYGVSYVGGTKDALTIENDDVNEDDISNLITAWFDQAQQVSRPGAYWYATVPPGSLFVVFAADWKKRGILRQILIWAKDSMVLGHSEYHYQHEPILFGWVPGKRHQNTDRTRTSIWNCKRPRRSAVHPTMKPVELWTRAIEDGSRSEEVVYDPFLGSGTTLVASEQLGRRCFGMELSPIYCDIIVKRWQDFTGKKAVRDDGVPFDEVGPA
jgi:DNA modification methylase